MHQHAHARTQNHRVRGNASSRRGSAQRKDHSHRSYRKRAAALEMLEEPKLDEHNPRCISRRKRRCNLRVRDRLLSVFGSRQEIHERTKGEMTMDRVELILRMAQNKAEEGKEVTAEINARGAAYLAEIKDLLAMARDAVDILERQEQRFAHFDPNRRMTHNGGQQAITEQRRTGEQKDGRAAK